VALVEPHPFAVATSRALGHVVLTVRGELDAASGPALGAVLHDIVEQQGRLDVIIDLAQVEFIDSRGLAVLLYGDRILKARGGNLTLSAPRPQVRKVVEVMGLTQHFTLTET